MEVDSLSSSHPVSTPVENPTQIQEMFDDVSYDKVGQVFSIDVVQDWNVLHDNLKQDTLKMENRVIFQ